MNTTNIARALTTILFAGTMAAVVGCTAESGAADDEGQVGAVAQAIGQESCTTVGAQDYEVLGSAGTTASGTSQDQSTYSLPTSVCSNAYIVEVGLTQGRSYTPFASWGDVRPANQKACLSSQVNAELWGYVPAIKNFETGQTIAAHWVHITSITTDYGTWDPRGFCFAPSLDFSTVNNSGFSKIRVVGQALQSGNTLMKVTLGARAH